MSLSIDDFSRSCADFCNKAKSNSSIAKGVFFKYAEEESELKFEPVPMTEVVRHIKHVKENDSDASTYINSITKFTKMVEKASQEETSIKSENVPEMLFASYVSLQSIEKLRKCADKSVQRPLEKLEETLDVFVIQLQTRLESSVSKLHEKKGENEKIFDKEIDTIFKQTMNVIQKPNTIKKAAKIASQLSQVEKLSQKIDQFEKI